MCLCLNCVVRSRQAKEKQLRIWKEYKPVTSTSIAKNFTGKVSVSTIIIFVSLHLSLVTGHGGGEW